VRAPRLVLGVVLSLAVLGLPAAEARPAGAVPRIGALVVASPGFAPIEGFRCGLRELGYVEGQNIVVEYRYARGDASRYCERVAEMVGMEPDVIAAMVHRAAALMDGS
jgi:putative ABC transport system substrate-binding protein